MVKSRHIITNLASGSLPFIATCLVAMNPIIAHASPVVGFDAGNIMDDLTFINSDSMSLGQIQAFLNSKVPVCDTNGTQTSEFGGGTRAQWGTAHGYSPPYTCLKDYTENSLSSAQIIYNAAHQYSINPEVLIVLLQKEQGLVTDTWPLSIQYRSATGYGCPDTAPCDSQYYGLTNQINQAANMFHQIMIANPNWYSPYIVGNNTIYWSPNHACGTSTVNIQSRATAALYDYTPYRPNQAALNAGYGTGDSCSSYGNRNFYQYFTDWFGATVGAQDLITDGIGIYYVSNGYKYYIPTMDDFYNYGYTPSDIPRIVRTSSAVVNSIPNNPNTSQISPIVASDSQGIFLISNGNKYYIPTMDLLHAYGFQDSDIVQVTEPSINRFRTADKNLSSFISDDTGFAYRIESGERHGIFQPWVLNQYPDANTSNHLSWPTLNRIPIGVPITGGKLTLVSGNNTYLAVNGKWFSISDLSIGTCSGSEGVVTINSNQTRAGTSVSTIDSCFVIDENNNKFLLDGSLEYAIQDNDEIQYSSINSTDGINNMTSVPYRTHKNIFATKDGIFELQNGTARHIMYMGYVQNALGGGSPALLNIDSISKLSKGANIYATGSLLAGPTGGINLVVNDELSYISSMDQFNTFGFNLKQVVNVGDGELNKQARGSALPGPRVSCQGLYYVISNGTKYLVSDPLLAAFGGSGNFAAVDCSVIATLPSANMTRFVTSPNNGNIYYIDNGTSRHILAWPTFLDLGGTVNSVIALSKYTLDSFPAGSDI